MTFKVRERIENYRAKNPVDWALLEQDYALSWMLYGIATLPALSEHLVFKGGTCLKKCYFGDYRFSQDLDFSTHGNCPTGDELEALITHSCETITRTLQATKNNVTFTCKRYVEKRPHPNNQEAFSILVHYPWQREPLTRIMVEITLSETVYLPIQQRALIHGYGDEIQATLSTYSLEEIIAEKISALLSLSKKLHERGWARSRARDYYDLWRMFSTYKEIINVDLIPDLAAKKCAHKNLVFHGLTDIFAENLMQNLDTAWEQWVRPLVVTLPEKKLVIEELKRIFEEHERHGKSDRIESSMFL